jgi:hypothetical protein
MSISPLFFVPPRFFIIQLHAFLSLGQRCPILKHRWFVPGTQGTFSQGSATAKRKALRRSCPPRSENWHWPQVQNYKNILQYWS